MDRFNRLLVFTPLEYPVDAVVRTADELARENEASVTLVNVVDSGSSFFRRSRPAAEQLDLAIEDAVENRLEETAARFKNVQPEVVVRQGVSFVEVIHQVYDSRADLVLVGSDARAASSARLDPTLAHLLRKSPVPVWVVDEAHQAGDVMVAIGPEYDEEGRVLNKTILELGSSLAERMGVACHVSHAWRVHGESLLLGSRVQLSREDVDELMSGTEHVARAMLDELIEEVPAASDAEIHLVHGRPEEELVRLVESIEPAVVVMGTLARKGIAGLIVGNTAERVLQTIDASVIAVKPPWFESPVPPPLDEASLDFD